MILSQKTGTAPGRLLTVEDMAQWLGMSRWGIYRLVSERRIPHRKIGRLLRFDPGDVQAWLDARRVAEHDGRTPMRPRR